jgi:hypothetical protein
MMAMVCLMVVSDLAVRPKTVKQVRVLRGDEAKAHMEALWNSTPTLHAQHLAAVRHLESLGRKPAGHYFAKIQDHAKPLPLQRLTALVIPGVLAQSELDGDGEVDISEWTGGSTEVDAEITETLYEDNSSDSGAVGVHVDGSVPPWLQWATTPTAQRWANCFLAGCGGAVAACGASWALGAGGFFACSVAWCDGAGVGCAITSMRQRSLCRARRDDNC